LAREGRSACVVTDDLARPTKASNLLPKVLERLQQAGIGRENTTILIATGMHGSLDKSQVALKVGADVASKYRIEVHDAKAVLGPTGIQYGQQEMRINATFLRADVKVGIGSVLPHAFAGYSGGAKLMMPGLADVAATARSHKFVQMGLRGGQDPNKNRFRLEIERLAKQVGFRFTICVVPNSRRESAGVYAGDIVGAHRRACEAAAKTFATPMDAEYDCAVLNAYPKDIDLIQAEGALLPLKGLGASLIADEGVIIITTAASEGLGIHGLFGPGGVSYRAPQPKRSVGKREIRLYSPNLTEKDVRYLYSSECLFFRDTTALMNALSKRLPSGARVAVLPCAPIQQITDRRKPV
jgi:nickel-dependent lactate racemase